MGYKLARFLINLLLRISASREVYGLENLPKEGSYVAAANHLGRLDAFYTYYYLDREDIILLAAEKYEHVPIISWLANQLNVIWVDRYNADFAAIREALKRIRAGGVLVLAPEGTRSKSGALQQAYAGGSYLAAKADLPIIPAAIIGSEDAKVFSQLRSLKRPHIVLRVGEPFKLPPLPNKDREATLEIYTDEIMCHIAALLPPEYRGVYADHPRLKELLAETGDLN